MDWRREETLAGWEEAGRSNRGEKEGKRRTEEADGGKGKERESRFKPR